MSAALDNARPLESLASSAAAAAGAESTAAGSLSSASLGGRADLSPEATPRAGATAPSAYRTSTEDSPARDERGASPVPYAEDGHGVSQEASRRPFSAGQPSATGNYNPTRLRALKTAEHLVEIAFNNRRGHSGRRGAAVRYRQMDCVELQAFCIAAFEAGAWWESKR